MDRPGEGYGLALGVERRQYPARMGMPEIGRRSAVAAKSSEPGAGFRSGYNRGHDEELALVAAIAAQDGGAFRTLLDRYLAKVLATARRLLNDAAEAEDIAQETMLRLWRSGGNIDLGAGGLEPWLRRVAINLSIDRLRSGKFVAVVEELPEQVQDADQLTSLEDQELSGRVGTALKSLPGRQYQALTLFHYEGLSQTEIASTMGISEEAVESLLARARRTLRGGLQKEWRGLLSNDA